MPSWFRNQRKQLGLSVEEIAVCLRTSVTSVRNWEAGVCAPEPWRGEDLAQVYQVTPTIIAGEIVKLAVAARNRKSSKRGVA